MILEDQQEIAVFEKHIKSQKEPRAITLLQSSKNQRSKQHQY